MTNSVDFALPVRIATIGMPIYCLAVVTYAFFVTAVFLDFVEKQMHLASLSRELSTILTVQIE